MNSIKASAAVIISGVLAILGSVFAILGIALGLMGLYLTPRSETRPAMPPYVASIAVATMLVLLGIAVFGIITGIGVIRLKNWARISILVFSGITVFFGGTALVFLLAMPFPTPAGGATVNPAVVKGVVMSVYGLPVLISLWWLVLFNQKGIKAQFVGVASESQVGFSTNSGCPLPVRIISVFYLFSLAWVFVIPFMHMPIPAIFLGHRIYGVGGKALLVFTWVLLGVGAIGLLKLKKWSYPLVLGVQGFWLLSGTVTALSPSYAGIMQEVWSEMRLPEGASVPFSAGQLRFMSLFGILFNVLVMGILVYYRRHFIEGASAREALPPG